jgi:hypothetical protein
MSRDPVKVCHARANNQSLTQGLPVLNRASLEIACCGGREEEELTMGCFFYAA